MSKSPGKVSIRFYANHTDDLVRGPRSHVNEWEPDAVDTGTGAPEVQPSQANHRVPL